MKKPAKKTKRRLRAFDLFCGAGGSSFGARAAGLKIVGGVEWSPLAAKTYRKNFPRAKVFEDDIHDLTAASVAKKVGRIDILLASPECTNHTVAKGKRQKVRAAQRSRMTAYAVISFAKAMKPRWIVVENVIQMRNWSRYKHWLNELERLGYKATPQILDAASFGVRQTRRRLFVLFGKDRVPPLVKPLRSRPLAIRPILSMNGEYNFSLLRTKKRAKPTLARAQRGIRGTGGGKPFLLVYYGSDGSGGWQPLSSPLRTITTLDRFALIRRNHGRYRMRMLQVPELKQAMGFPLSFRMPYGSRRARIGMLGNGVCPPVMKHIVKTLLKAKSVSASPAAQADNRING